MNKFNEVFGVVVREAGVEVLGVVVREAGVETSGPNNRDPESGVFASPPPFFFRLGRYLSFLLLLCQSYFRIAQCIRI